MFGFLIVLIIIVSVLLTIVVLMQASKGGGLAGTFGGAGMGAVFGVRRTADFLSRMTTILASAFIVLCLLINLFFLPGKSSNESVIQSGPTQQQVPTIPQMPGQSAPATGSGRQQQPPPQNKGQQQPKPQK